MVKSTCSTQMLLCVFVYMYMHMTFIDMNIAHIIHIHVSNTLYTIGDIGRMHAIGRCPPTVNICMRFLFVCSTCITWIYTNVCKSE